MDGKVHNQRIFIMFNREDAGFEDGQAPAGYVKIETRDGKGRLSAMVQNLKHNGNMSYSLYLMKCSGKNVFPVKVGGLHLQKGRGDIQWGFDSNNVASTGYTIEEFNVAAVLAEYENRENTDIKCPLAAYKGEKVDWREGLKKAFKAGKPKYEEIEEDVLVRQDIPEVFKEAVEYKQDSETVKTATVETDSAPDEQKPDSMTADRASDIPEGMVGISFEPLNQAKEPENVPEGEPCDDKNQAANGIESDKAEDNVGKETYDSTLNKQNEVTQGDEGKPAMENVQQDNGGCVYKDNNICNFRQGVAGYYNPCLYCNIAAVANDNDKKAGQKGNSELLRKNLDRYFEICDPFGSRRRDYKWWKVNNPVYLNNVLYQCNIKTPLLFNPRVMMAHFKYKHLIVGIYTDRMRRKEYLVCGVPGTYNIDEKPFGEICRWVQLQGNRPKYGAFGYWLVYMDISTGDFINFA